MVSRSIDRCGGRKRGARAEALRMQGKDGSGERGGGRGVKLWSTGAASGIVESPSPVGSPPFPFGGVRRSTVTTVGIAAGDAVCVSDGRRRHGRRGGGSPTLVRSKAEPHDEDTDDTDDIDDAEDTAVPRLGTTAIAGTAVLSRSIGVDARCRWGREAPKASDVSHFSPLPEERTAVEGRGVSPRCLGGRKASLGRRRRDTVGAVEKDAETGTNGGGGTSMGRMEE